MGSCLNLHLLVFTLEYFQILCYAQHKSSQHEWLPPPPTTYQICSWTQTYWWPCHVLKPAQTTAVQGVLVVFCPLTILSELLSREQLFLLAIASLVILDNYLNFYAITWLFTLNITQSTWEAVGVQMIVFYLLFLPFMSCPHFPTTTGPATVSYTGKSLSQVCFAVWKLWYSQPALGHFATPLGQNNNRTPKKPLLPLQEQRQRKGKYV